MNKLFDFGNSETTISTKVLLEVAEYVFKLEQDNKELNAKLNELSNIICEGIEESLNQEYFVPHFNSMKIIGLLHDPIEFEREYEKLLRVRKESKVERD